jgi:hypothetical protein
MRLYNPEKNGRLETPVDERGLVDLDQLVTLVKQTVRPEFSWSSSFNDIHHLQWFASNYSGSEATGGLVDMGEFRELVNRKAFIPRVFHNWIHHVTLPPPVPSIEVMKYSVDAQRVAMSLSRTAGLAARLTRMTQIPEKKLEQRLDEEFINYALYVDNARNVPVEFSLFAIEEVEARSVDEMLIANKHLGRLALDKVPIRQRQVLRAA